jgi:predicted acylesterase/phospholipase RssA
VLHYLERDGNLAIRDEFDFFAGVSTGAMVAAYLANNAGSVEVLALNEYSSARLTQSYFDKSIWDKLLDRFQNQPKYDGRRKRARIETLLGGVFINDIKDKHLLILAYDFINRELVTFKNNSTHDATYNQLLAEICDAATAAPTIYPTIPTTAPKRRRLVDGALATNDPSHCAISEALAMGHALEEIWMVSLGTGKPTHDLSQKDRDRIGMASRDWGILGWIRNDLFDHMMTPSSAVSPRQCQQLLGARYLRIDGKLPRKLMQVDNTTEVRVEDLRSYALLWLEQFAEQVEQLLAGVHEARTLHAGATLPDI